MKRIIEVVCAGVLGVGVFFPTSTKAFVSTLTNINNQNYAITDSNSEMLLALPCNTCDGDGGDLPPRPIPSTPRVPSPQLNLRFYPRLERNQIGYSVYLKGEGFTPGGVVSFTVENLAGSIGAKSIGIFATVKANGTFDTSPVVWYGYTWPRGGTATLRAIDKASGQSITTPIPALY